VSKIATTVYDTEDIILQDGTEVTLRPNSIKRQRKFMKALEASETPKSNDEATDQILELAAICLDGLLVKGEDGEEPDLEDLLDEPTIYKIIEVCGGIKLNDPNLLAAAAAMTEQNLADGQN
jgi:hypothetical protein